MQVDIEWFSHNPVDDVGEHQILCYRHLRHVNSILQGKSAVFQLLHKDYAADIQEMGHRLLNDFIEAPANGPQTLLRFAEAAYSRVAAPTKNGIALWTSQILSIVGGFIFEMGSGDDLLDRHQFYRDVLKYFRDYDTDLQEPGKVVDVGVAKDLLIQFSTLLLELCQWDDALAAEIGEELLPFREPDSPTASSDDIEQYVRRSSFSQDPGFRATLISNAWKFKLLRKYVVKGRMELRVMSIGTMDNALVEIWREYNTTAQSTGHPVMQYLAEFLLHEQIIDYIISVDSHPQLISRSGNIVGFLVVTRRYSESQTDAIWRTISNSQDPRVVAATLTMLRNITSLMDSPELLYLCSKLYDLPIEHYSLDVVRFLKDISDKIRQKVYQWDAVDRKSRPWNVCIRVMQDTSPGRTSTKLTLDLFREACEQLVSVSTSVGPEERAEIYTDCAVHIAEQSPKATGSIRAIFVLCGNANYPDTNFFKQNLEVIRYVLEELCSFVETENRQGPNQFNPSPLDYRLDLLRFFVLRTPEAIPSDLYLTIWDHVIGKYALNNYVRDKAWAKFSEAVKYTPDNEFCRSLISTYVPSLEPEYFTPGLYDFVAHYRFPTTRQLTTTEDGEKTLLQIRGGDLLWRMVQTAPQGTIEDRAAKQLAARYVEIDTTQDVSLEELEDAHVALVEKCMVELLSDYKALRNGAQQGVSVGMDVIVSDTTRTQMELRFARTLNFVKLLLVIIRTKSEFSRTPRSDSKVEIFEPDITFGDTTEITYNIPSTSEKQTAILGTGNTLRDLETRICQATGFTKVNMFFAGQRLDLSQKAHETLADLGLAPKAHVLVQKAAGSEARQPIPDSKASCSIYEMTILNHFEELFEYMDSDDCISQVLFDFLSHFPFRERIADGVATGSASANDIFPPGKLFQAKYAACALQYKLREHLRKSTLDDTFLFNAVKILVEALLNTDLISESINGRNELHLASFLVTILLEFLKERPRATTSYQYFSDGASFVDRLIKILDSALKAPFDSANIVFNSYAAILEASLHSRRVWEAFITRPDIRGLHKTLLTNQFKHLRQNIATSIASVCGGDLPSTSPLDKAETAAYFWGLISDVLPDAVGHAAQSEQLFEIAEQVFRSHDECNSRDEESLRACLASWSDILLHYDHQEFVGRDDVDYVTSGFTKLLLCSIPSIKSFKKPLGVGNLMEQIYRRFLFVSPESSRLPVLESNTRKELYDLVLALAEDGNSYNTLLNLTETLAKDEETISANSYGIERANEIRSPTGYVGLLNPRAICYSNSLVTQLFMNVNFRKFLLGLDVADASSQRLLSETQSLFANLQNSFRKSADPRPFAACVKGIDGQPIDINIQMDADEFYNLLFDQWEGQMLSPEVKQRFRSFYGGQTVNQIKSKECEHVSERVESFFVVQCDVQGKANLHESLQAFVDGDVMEGDNKYKCESCGGKFVDAVKRTCLKDVPDNLIFHLKRFDFDLVEMRRSKINDCFVFPEQIDVSAYNVEHLTDPSKPRTEDIFELVGVLVHQGTSENGHYYSYIRERPCSSTNMNHWVEFNDRDVDTFDHHTIPYQAFGGWYDEQFPRQQKQFSAYMLFYQRKTAIENDHHEYIRSPQCGAPTVPVPAELEASINEENQSFVKDYTIHDQNHTKFTRQILNLLRTVNHGTCSEDHQQESQALRIVLEHLSQTLSRQRIAEYFDETMAQLRKTTLACPTCCHIVVRWFASHETALTGLLLRCPHMKIRSQVRAYLIDTLRVVREKEPALYHGAEISSPDTDMEANSSAPSEGVLVEIICRLRIVADDAWVSARGWDDFFLTLCQIALLGNIETALLLNHGILAFGLKVLSMHAHPPFRASEPDLWRLVEKKKSIFNRYVKIQSQTRRLDETLASLTACVGWRKSSVLFSEYRG
jgi:ubiquitin carboxyl-terminal hydrolase 34